METLSDKEIYTDGYARIYNAVDVKEFIKEVQAVVLKKGRRAKIDIDELAGDKLI